jgi:SARP family transcriptional regulator, regulator of embCAB operon
VSVAQQPSRQQPRHTHRLAGSGTAEPTYAARLALASSQGARPETSSDRIRVLLLDRVRVTVGFADHVLSPGSERLIAFLALHRHGVRRAQAAGTLWPEVCERRAHACLRSALARLGASSGAVSAGIADVALASSVSVDLYELESIASDLVHGRSGVEPETAAAVIPRLSAELLPGWYEDWALIAAENWRQLRLHALEAAAALLAAVGRYGEATLAAGAAVAADPLRESAHAALIRVHLAEGNQSEAIREFERYRGLIKTQLGLEPTAGLRALLPSAVAS